MLNQCFTCKAINIFKDVSINGTTYIITKSNKKFSKDVLIENFIHVDQTAPSN